MFQCSESCADNYFHDITVNGDAATYSELVRLNSVRAFRLANMTLKGRFEKGTVRETSHNKELFMIVQPQGAFRAGSALWIDKAEGSGRTRQHLETATDLTLKDSGSGSPSVTLVSWLELEKNDLFRAAAKPGVKVYDRNDNFAHITFAARMTYAGVVESFRDKLYAAQLRIWKGTLPLPRLTSTINPRLFFEIIDFVNMGPGWAILGYRYDKTHPEVAPSGIFTCDLFRDTLVFAVESALIDDDNAKDVQDNKVGLPQLYSGTTSTLTIGSSLL